MPNRYLLVERSEPLCGHVHLSGAKNAVLVIMASLLLTNGVSTLHNVPDSADINQMITLLRDLGALVVFDASKSTVVVDTTAVNLFSVRPEIMNKMRASILVMGPLLARFGAAEVALPGGCTIGERPIDLHLKGFKKLGAFAQELGHILHAKLVPTPSPRKVVLDYPSVGATENLLMCATLLEGQTIIMNAALEPEVLDLIALLRSMGACIEFELPQTIVITGVATLHATTHHVIPDRLEAGALLIAAAMTGGSVYVPDARADHLDLFLEKLMEMGHEITTGSTIEGVPVPQQGIFLRACKEPRAVSFKTGPHPGFPTDLQAPMMAAQTLAHGTSHIEETVFENRLLHAKELNKMGAQIMVTGNRATLCGVDELYGTEVIATDIRASCAMALAGLVAQGQTIITGIHHWKRGYDRLEVKLRALGAKIMLIDEKNETSESTD